MDTQINRISICSKSQQRKDSLRLTLKKFKLFKLISTLEIIFIVAFNCWQHFGTAGRGQVNSCISISISN
jgi:hypothetical protein